MRDCHQVLLGVIDVELYVSLESPLKRHTSTRFVVLPAGLSGTADAAVGEASRAARNAADTNAPPVTAGWR